MGRARVSLVVYRRRDQARRAVRERVPFSWRLAVRRAPHWLSWWASPPAPLPTGPAFAHLVCARTTPLRRRGTIYDRDVQAGKESNVARAASALHGRVLAPGASLSWHAHVGPPVRVRGFVDGPELHDDRLALGVGGGACQAANLIYWLAVHGGLVVRERHRHGLDLFPDDARDVPFGLGATVFWPWRDLVVENPHPVPLHLALFVEDGALFGRLTAAEPLGATWSVEERGHRFVRRGREVWRMNRLLRWRRSADGRVEMEELADHAARVAYAVPDASVQEEL
jgi:vancomycin resistance protein VanW